MRTERYHVCLGCFARQVRLDACARCGGRDLVDLRAPAGRAFVAERIASAGRERVVRVKRSGMEVWVIMVGALFGAAVLWLEAVTVGSAALIIATFVAILAVTSFLGRWFADREGDSDDAVLRSVTPRLECVDRVRAEAGPPPLAIARVRGRVRVTRAVEAPVSGRRCAAARVTGAAFGDVDDAVCGAFELVDAQGAVVARFDGTSAAVDVPAAEPTDPTEAEGALRAFLGERMVHRSGARVSLGESVIVDGDCVTLEGPAEDGIVAEGYRESRAVKVFRGTGAWPVLVRREGGEARVRVDVATAPAAAEPEARAEAARRGRR